MKDYMAPCLRKYFDMLQISTEIVFLVFFSKTLLINQIIVFCDPIIVSRVVSKNGNSSRIGLAIPVAVA